MGSFVFALARASRKIRLAAGKAAAARPVQSELRIVQQEITIADRTHQTHVSDSHFLRTKLFHPGPLFHKLTAFWSLAKVSMEHLELFSRSHLEYLI